MAQIVFETPYSEKKAELIESLIEFALDKLMSRHQHDRLRVTVEFDRNLLRRDQEVAYILPDSFTEYTICVDSTVPLATMLMSVAHEVVHIKQYALGQGAVLMNRVDRDQNTPITEDAYWDDPLEIEAYGRELGLFVMWCSRYGHTKKKWAQLDSSMRSKTL